MHDIRFVPAPLPITFDLNSINSEAFLKEFSSMSEYEEDIVGQWLKNAKAKGETKESDQVLLTLLVELHKKVDELTAIIKNEQKPLLKLSQKGEIVEIGFEHIKLQESKFTIGESYYARIDMPIFPKREIPLFIEALSPEIAKIVKIHEKDERDWNSYVTARERVMIRELRGKRDV
jgi:hypothetical protein